MFEIEYLSVAAWCAIGLSTLAGIYLLTVLLPRLVRIKHYALAEEIEQQQEQELPPVSVVIYADTEASNIRRVVPQLFSQEYGGMMEVVVITDEGNEIAADVVRELQITYRELYMTFTPGQSRNLSRRKLSLTIGVKAAHHECVILITGCCVINSPLWLRSMARHFSEGAEVVIGYATLLDLKGEDHLRGSRCRAFDRAFVAARWLSSAIAGKPTRGCGYNLGYTKRLFFNHKGFANSLGLFAGDDDVFVNELVSDAQYALEISPESIIEIYDYNPVHHQYMDNMSRRFTSRFLPRGGFRLFGSFSCAWWVWFLCGVAGIVLSLPTIIGAISFALSVVWLGWPMIVGWRNLCRTLKIRPLFVTTFFLSLFHPIYTLRFRMRRRNAVRDYCWERP